MVLLHQVPVMEFIPLQCYFLKSGFMYVYAKLFPLISVFCYSMPRFCAVSISCSLQGLILLSSVHLSVCHASVCLSDEADGTCVPCGCFYFCFLYEYSLPIHCLPSWVISPSFHYSVKVCTMPTFLVIFLWYLHSACVLDTAHSSTWLFPFVSIL